MYEPSRDLKWYTEKYLIKTIMKKKTNNNGGVEQKRYEKRKVKWQM